ncbi:MAG: hypothetical protein G01um101425_1007 [Candidatus Peregrinibacteria bacterium Gr01-1014_25]|nr:MAG: hypothetical protein G01um101425_1007 [Candidatus Peregrinibacteria bacterium Gr01-1014_25]
MSATPIKALAVFSALALLAGCSGAMQQKAAEEMMENAIEKEAGGDADVDIDAAGKMRVTTKEGTFTTGNQLPADWPKDAPSYAGAEVQYAMSTNPATGKPGAAVVLMTDDGMQEVANFYTDALKANGWSIESTMNGADTTIMAATKDGRTFSLAIVSADGQTTITVGIENAE